MSSTVSAGYARALVIASVLALSLLASPVALATTGHSFADQFGAAGNGDGQFAGGPTGIAVLPASGDVLTSDPGHTLVDGVTPDPRVERFDGSESFQSAFSIDGAVYNSPGGLAVDPSGSESVYITALDNVTGGGAILKYGAAGGFDHALDVSGSGTALSYAAAAVDPVDGTAYAIAADGSGLPVIDSFDAVTGTFVSSFDGTNNSPDGSGFACPNAVAVDGAHQVYVVDPCKGLGRVDRYSPAGAYAATIDDGGRGQAIAIAVDQSSGDVFVAESAPAGLQITSFAAGGSTPGQTFSAAGVADFRGVAVDHGSGTVFTADAGNAVVQRFAAFDGPTVVTDAAVPVGTTSATLNGTVDPGGVPADYHFEYGIDTSYGTSTADTSAGSGSAPVAAAAAITGLVFNTTYHYRIVGTNAAGAITGGDHTLTTGSVPPTIGGAPFTSSIFATSVTIHGTINPNHTATGFHVDYGTTTAYGTPSPQPDADAGSGVVATPVETTLTGLLPGTTYHFRITADNGTGGAQHGVDGTFTTAPGASVDATGLTTSKATLTGTVNPHGAPTTYHFDYGLTAAYGEMTVEADGGSGDGDETVSQDITGLAPSTTYHVRVVATSGGETRTGVDGTFTTPAAPAANAVAVTGVSVSAATVASSVDTYGLPGTYRFEVASLDSPYAITTPDRAVAGAQPVSAALSGLPAGETFRVRLVVSSNDATSYSDQVTFATAALPKVFPTPPVADAATYGCAGPVIDAYNKKPQPGDTIAITGSDLGVGGTVALGDAASAPADWSPTGFTVQVPLDATGTLPLTVNCGHLSNTIAVAIFHEPDNRFTITKTSVAGTVATLTARAPGPGKLEASATHASAGKTTVSKAGTATVRVRLSDAGASALNKARSRTLRVAIRVRFTPAGGKPASKTVTVTFKRKASR
jgi:hypothetical protein